MARDALPRPIGRSSSNGSGEPPRHGKTGASSLRPLSSSAFGGGANDNGDVNAEKGPRLAVAWSEMVAALATHGWARAPQALDDALARRLAEDDGRQWRTAGDKGVVRQHVIGSYRPFAEAPAAVRAVGDEVVGRLSAEAGRQGLVPVPPFNEATWGRYPAGTGHITAHRDPAAYGGVVAVFTLFGQALFRVWDADGEAAEWETGSGQLVLMRAAGWPQTDSRCPLHEVEPPRDEERMIMTLRHNTGGAGAGYVV